MMALSAELTLTCQTVLHGATEGRFREAALQRGRPGECQHRAATSRGATKRLDLRRSEGREGAQTYMCGEVTS